MAAKNGSKSLIYGPIWLIFGSEEAEFRSRTSPGPHIPAQDPLRSATPHLLSQYPNLPPYTLTLGVNLGNRSILKLKFGVFGLENVDREAKLKVSTY